MANEGASQVYESDRLFGRIPAFSLWAPMTSNFLGRKVREKPWVFPVRSVEELIDWESSVGSALDLGQRAVGKSSFVLSEIAQEVVGIDFSKSFIGAAQSILQNGKLCYQYHEEGTRWKEGVVVTIEHIPQNLTFEVGDACNLREDMRPFDLLHAANLLCRLPDPMSLSICFRLPDLVVPGGQLILTTPLPRPFRREFTSWEKWPQWGRIRTRLNQGAQSII